MNEQNESTGARLARLRRAQNITQEALAETLGVSRQAVSKWESDLAYPETDKLLRLSRLYGCTVDYLLTGERLTGERLTGECAPSDTDDTPADSLGTRLLRAWDHRPHFFEYKSRRTLGGVPLLHINIGVGRRARGIVAVGLSARGVVAIGLAAMGVLSVGLLSLGVLSLGVLALGLLMAVACIAVGTVAIGAIALGLLAVGALSVGLVSLGALAVGRYLAIGDYAYGSVTVGMTLSEGSRFCHLGALDAVDLPTAESVLEAHCPEVLRGVARWLLRAVCR